MSFPAPVPGLVLRYAYLWKREAETGREEAAKDRPCAIILTSHMENNGQRVFVLPVTHSPPAQADMAVEIPAATKSRLGLDAHRSWIVVTEVNEFVWPGPDLRPIPGSSNVFTYGILPPGFFRIVRERFLACARNKHGVAVRRSG